MVILIVARVRPMVLALFTRAVFLVGEGMFDQGPDF